MGPGRRVRRNRRQPVVGTQTPYINIHYYYLRHVERWCILYNPFSNPRTVRVQFPRVHVFPPPRPHGCRGGGSTRCRRLGAAACVTCHRQLICKSKTKTKKKKKILIPNPAGRRKAGAFEDPRGPWVKGLKNRPCPSVPNQTYNPFGVQTRGTKRSLG